MVSTVLWCSGLNHAEKGQRNPREETELSRRGSAEVNQLGTERTQDLDPDIHSRRSWFCAGEIQFGLGAIVPRRLTVGVRKRLKAQDAAAGALHLHVANVVSTGELLGDCLGRLP